MATAENRIIIRLEADTAQFNSSIEKSKKEAVELAANFGRVDQRAGRAIRNIGREASRSNNLLARLRTGAQRAFGGIRNSARRAFTGIRTGAALAGRAISAAFTAATAGISLLLQAAGGLATLIGTLATAFAGLTLNSTAAGRALRDEIREELSRVRDAAEELIKDLIPIGLAIIEVFKEVGSAIADFFIDTLDRSGDTTESFGVRAAAAITAFFESVRSQIIPTINRFRIFDNQVRQASLNLERLAARRRGDAAELARLNVEIAGLISQNERLRDQIAEANTVSFSDAFMESVNNFQEVADELNSRSLQLGRNAGKSFSQGVNEELVEGSLAFLRNELKQVEEDFQNLADTGSPAAQQLGEDYRRLTAEIAALEAEIERVKRGAVIEVDVVRGEVPTDRVGTGDIGQVPQSVLDDLNSDIERDRLAAEEEQLRRTTEAREEYLKGLSAQAQAFQALGGAFGELSQQFEEGSAAQAIALRLQAAASIAAAIANIQLALTQGLAQPFPQNLIAVASIISAIATITAAVRQFGQTANENVPAFAEGTPFVTGKNHTQRTKRDAIPAFLDHGERVFSAKDNEAFKKISNERVIEMFRIGQLYSDMPILKPIEQIVPNYASLSMAGMERELVASRRSMEKYMRETARSNSDRKKDMHFFGQVINKVANRPIEIKNKSKGR